MELEENEQETLSDGSENELAFEPFPFAALGCYCCRRKAIHGVLLGSGLERYTPSSSFLDLVLLKKTNPQHLDAKLTILC